MGWFTSLLKVGSMMDWGTPVVNIARKANGCEVVTFTDDELAEAERIVKRHGGRGLDITWDGAFSMMVPGNNADACREDLARMRKRGW